MATAAPFAWLDLVPGGREAFNWLRAHVQEFLALGPALEAQLRVADQIWTNLAPPPVGGRPAVEIAILTRWVELRNAILADLAEWRRLEPAVRWVASLIDAPDPSTPPPQLGAWPIVALIAAVTLTINVQLLVRQWLAARPTRERALSDLMHSAVAANMIAPADAAAVLDAGGRAGLGETLSGLVKWGAVAVAGVLVLQAILPPRSRRRR